MDSVFGLSFGIEGIEDEKESKIAIFQEFFRKKPWSRIFFEIFFRRKYSLGSCAFFNENMVSVSVLGFIKFASQIWKKWHMSRNLRQKNVALWAFRKARAPKIGATACRAWPRAETFNGLQKVLQIVYVPGSKSKWTYIVSDQEVLMKERWMKKYFFEKNERRMFGKKTKASYLMTETLIVKELAYILASDCEGEWFSYLFSVLRKLSYKLGKNGKIFKFLLHPFICPKKPERKKFDVLFSFKRSLLNNRTNYESMDCVLVLGLEI